MRIMEQNITWVLVADASKARLFSLCKARFFQDQAAKNLHLLHEFAHAKSRQKECELSADRQGMFGSGSFVESTSPKVHEADVFASELAHQLEAGRREKNFHDLVLIAPAHFMGLLHKHIAHETHKLISQSIEKDYTHQNERELTQSLLQYF